MLDKFKGAIRSVTIWFNGVSGVLLVALPIAQETLPQLAQFLPANVYQVASALIIVGNVLLRFKTSVPLEAK